MDHFGRYVTAPTRDLRLQLCHPHPGTRPASRPLRPPLSKRQVAQMLNGNSSAVLGNGPAPPTPRPARRSMSPAQKSSPENSVAVSGCSPSTRVSGPHRTCEVSCIPEAV